MHIDCLHLQSSDLLTMQYMLNNKSKDAEFKKNERNSVHRNKRSGIVYNTVPSTVSIATKQQ